MSHSEHYTDTGPTTAFYQGVESGEQKERERIIRLLRARVTKHHPILTMDIDDLGVLISARTHETQATAVVADLEKSDLGTNTRKGEQR